MFPRINNPQFISMGGSQNGDIFLCNRYPPK